MRLDKKITYICNYKNTSWQCVLKDISIDDRITGFTVSARGSRYRVYVINFDMKRWLDIPGIGVSSELSSLDDIFWNSEKIACYMNSIIDGLTIAKGLSIISAHIAHYQA